MYETKTAPIEAILIMDTRSVRSGLRNQDLVGNWSRLYKADQLYLDLSLKVERGSAVLMGQVIEARPTDAPASEPALKGQACLKTLSDSLAAQVELDESGGFRLDLPRGITHHLEVRLPNLTVRISDLTA